jgi:hypothetical protein
MFEADIDDETKFKIISKFGKDVICFGDDEDEISDLVVKMSAIKI